VLRGLDYLRKVDVTPDERVAEAIKLVESKRDDQGRWRNLSISQPPNLNPLTRSRVSSRWNTLRAYAYKVVFSARQRKHRDGVIAYPLGALSLD